MLPLLLKVPTVEAGKSVLKHLAFLKSRPDARGPVEELFLSQRVLRGIVLGNRQEVLCLLPRVTIKWQTLGR